MTEIQTNKMILNLKFTEKQQQQIPEINKRNDKYKCYIV